MGWSVPVPPVPLPAVPPFPPDAPPPPPLVAVVATLPAEPPLPTFVPTPPPKELPSMPLFPVPVPFELAETVVLLVTAVVVPPIEPPVVVELVCAAELVVSTPLVELCLDTSPVVVGTVASSGVGAPSLLHAPISAPSALQNRNERLDIIEVLLASKGRDENRRSGARRAVRAGMSARWRPGALAPRVGVDGCPSHEAPLGPMSATHGHTAILGYEEFECGAKRRVQSFFYRSFHATWSPVIFPVRAVGDRRAGTVGTDEAVLVRGDAEPVPCVTPRTFHRISELVPSSLDTDASGAQKKGA